MRVLIIIIVVTLVVVPILQHLILIQSACFDDNSCIPFIYGCTDTAALNYDILANTDDGSCSYCAINVTAIGINPSPYNCDGSIFAIVDGAVGTLTYSWSNGSNNYFAQNLCGGTYTVTVTSSVGCSATDTITLTQNGMVVLGCTDSTALNYNPQATINDGSCEYCDLSIVLTTVQNSSNSACDGMAVVYATSSNHPINFIWNTGDTVPYIQNLCSGTYTVTVYDSLCFVSESVTIGIIFGCTDSSAFNYDPLANTDDGSCVPYIYGCTDSSAFNYDPLANTDNGSCIPIIFGCMNPVASNYDPNANVDNGSCLGVIYGCTDPLAINYHPGANTLDPNNPCCYIAGCTDITAMNYNANACIDDGSCAYSNNCLKSNSYWYSCNRYYSY